MGNWIKASLARVGHLWVENPWYLLGLFFRFFATDADKATLLFSTAEQKRSGYLRQTARSFMRTIFPIIGIGIIAGVILGNLGAELGLITQRIFEDAAFSILLRDVLPLILSVTLIARFGSSIAAKFSFLKVTRSYIPSNEEEVPRISSKQLRRLVTPYIVSGMLTCIPFYLCIVWFAISGYVNEGAVRLISIRETRDFLTQQNLTDSFMKGGALSIVYGGVIAYISSGIGIEYAEKTIYDGQTEDDNYYAVWESSAFSLLVCITINIILAILYK